jgi:hypothetical protein
MKITPDYKGRNDGYDKDTVRYWERVDENSYFYELYVLIDGNKSRIQVTEGGVCVDFKNPINSISHIDTNIIPKRLFPYKKFLEWEELYKIIKILQATGIEGRAFTVEEEEKLYKEWLKLGKP